MTGERTAVATPAVSNTLAGIQRMVIWDIRAVYPQQGKVPVAEWLDFLEKAVGADPLRDVSSAMIHSITGNLLVQLTDEETFKRVLRKAEDGVQWEKYGGKVYGWSSTEETTQVHLQNVIGDHALEAAEATMSKYGKILQKKEHHLRLAPQIKNGVVSLTMKLKPEVILPNFLYDEKGENTIQVDSERHERACWKCLGKGHPAVFCKKPRKTQGNAINSPTWAKLATSPTPITPPPAHPKKDRHILTEVPSHRAGPCVYDLPTEDEYVSRVTKREMNRRMSIPPADAKTLEHERHKLDRRCSVVGKYEDEKHARNLGETFRRQRFGQDISPELQVEIEAKRQRVRKQI